MNELTGHQGQDEYIPDREKAQRQLALPSDTYQQPRDAKCPTDPFWHQYTCEESDAEMTPGLGSECIWRAWPHTRHATHRCASCRQLEADALIIARNRIKDAYCDSNHLQ